MPAELPYMPSVTSLPAILDRMRATATPPKFTHDFLKTSLGFSSSNDRAVIKILRQLGLLAADGTPTPRYNDFRGGRGGVALADGLREGWAPLFLSDEAIQQRSIGELLGVVKNGTGAGDAVARKIATTFKALAGKATWEQGPSTAKDRPRRQHRILRSWHLSGFPTLGRHRQGCRRPFGCVTTSTSTCLQPLTWPFTARSFRL